MDNPVMEQQVMTLEEGWFKMEVGIVKMQRILEGEPEPQFQSEDYTNLYTTIYDMCTQKPPHDHSQELYDRYGKAIQDYCEQTVLPSLKKKDGEDMLKEFALRWCNHKVMVRWLSRFFIYMDRYFIAPRALPTLKEVGMTRFRDLVYDEMKSKATKAVTALIHKEREGEEIDRTLLKNVLDVYVEIGMGELKRYEEDFERLMLQDTTAYYSHKASSWIKEDPCHEYILKYEECLKEEKERAAHYLSSSTEPKLVKALEEVFEISGNKTVAGSSVEAERPSPEN